MHPPPSLTHSTGPLNLRLALFACLLLPMTTINITVQSSSISSSVRKLRGSRRELLAGGGETKWNSIDECWRGDEKWADRRGELAGCAAGFGATATGGLGGETYVVTDDGDDAQNPAIGTLRYGVTRNKPLWIIFDKHISSIRLEIELLIASNKTIDGRGANVTVGNGGPCFKLQNVKNVIIHGIWFRRCTAGKAGKVRVSPTEVQQKGPSDGDAITVSGSSRVWIDHNWLSEALDGLVDVVQGSTSITISNNYFANHDKVMLLGSSPAYTSVDSLMNVTLIFNHFGPGLTQRLPRCRFGLVHVINNNYDSGWGIYAIGGSSHPTIFSVGNYFKATSKKQVTKRIDSGNWSSWIWKSVNDTFTDGAFFVQSGTTIDIAKYGIHDTAKFSSYMTASAGPLSCAQGSIC